MSKWTSRTAQRTVTWWCSTIRSPPRARASSWAFRPTASSSNGPRSTSCVSRTAGSSSTGRTSTSLESSGSWEPFPARDRAQSTPGSHAEKQPRSSDAFDRHVCELRKLGPHPRLGRLLAEQAERGRKAKVGAALQHVEPELVTGPVKGAIAEPRDRLAAHREPIEVLRCSGIVVELDLDAPATLLADPSGEVPGTQTAVS